MKNFAFKEIKKNDPLIEECAYIVQKYSWGFDYPVNPLNELKQAEYIIGCFDGKRIVGFGSITRISSPDGKDNNKPWFADAVVLPEYRNKGIYTELYRKRLSFIKKQKESVLFSCTDNPIIEKFLEKNNWILYRETKDEKGDECKVFILKI